MERRTYMTSRGVRLLLDVPERRLERMRGLLGREELPPDRGVLLRRTRSVHTVGMRVEILVAFLDEGLRVIRIRRVRPGRVVWPRAKVRHVLELGRDADVRTGDRLQDDEAPDQHEHGRDAGDDAEVPGAILPRLPPGGGCWYARAPIV